MTHADYHPCSEGCGRDSELPGPCEECDMRRRIAARATGPALSTEALALLERMHALSEDLWAAGCAGGWWVHCSRVGVAWSAGTVPGRVLMPLADWLATYAGAQP